MKEHVIKVQPQDMDPLRAWLVRPTGGFRVGRVTFESVEDGGVLVRTQPWLPGNDS